MPIVNVRECGAVGDGVQDDSVAIQSAVDRVHRGGGGRVVLDGGVFRGAGIELRSGVTLHIEAGATLKGLDDLEAYRSRGFLVGVLYTVGAKDVAITGSGTIDGNGQHFFRSDKRFDSADYDPAFSRQGKAFKRLDVAVEEGPLHYDARPTNMIIFANCTGVTVAGVTLTNPAAWCQHFGDCESVRVTGLRVNNQQPLPNNDGMHCTSCRDVIVSDCNFDCADDCIAITGVRYEPHFGPAYRSEKDVCENIVITNCILRSRSSALRIGWGSNLVRNVTVGNLLIPWSNRGINICARGGGGVENVLIHDVVVDSRIMHGHWWGMGEAIHVSSMPMRFDGDDTEAPGKSGVIQGVSFSNIRSVSDSGVLLYANDPGDIRNCSFRDVSVRVRRGELEDLYGGNLDLRASDIAERQIFSSARAGVHLHGVQDSELIRLKVEMDPELPSYYEAPVLMEQCAGIEQG